MNIYCQNGGDPLLYQRPLLQSLYDGQQPQTTDVQQYPNMDNLNKAYNQLMMEIRQNASQTVDSAPPPRDWIGELDEKVANLDKSCIDALGSSNEYGELNLKLQGMVQNEIMSFVKDKLNKRSDVINCIQKQMDIISDITKKAREEERSNYSEMTDYMKNYSHLTFDEYKKHKQGVNKSSKEKGK